MYQQKGRNRLYPDVPLRNMKEILKNGRAISFLWDAIPDLVRSWLQAVASAINTQPEFLFLGAIAVTSCLMGPHCKFEVRHQHQESCNVFTLRLCEPGTGKTQAYKIAVEGPLEDLPEKLLVHHYMTKGIFEHLKSRDGRAIICHAEMTSFFQTFVEETVGRWE